ncbi:inactive poly [ADP-ribose] polymerase RCD1-like [Triticum dicoccoides]|uniref:inactive poly [ADP-ribose] polymerase RCD1-like n=1 Tax=Triticum dicoccoides TaxID=85692 RepID=UPI001890E93C|nr:inactive poly [ADP-ribose] polymerase RCD1-like [Triticum dicoccoides]
MDPLQKSKALCLKRKPDDDCLAKNSKSHHTEIDNVSSMVHSGSSSDLPAHSCHSQPNLANDCVNYLKSGAPSRVVFYKQGSWCDFPDKIVTSIVDAFGGDKSSIVVVMDDQPLLIDFLSMTLVNLKTRKQRSVAWLDGTNNWSFPSSFFDEEVEESAKLSRNVVEGAALGSVRGNVVKPPSDVAKQAMLEASPPVIQSSCALDILRKKIVHVERGSESFLFVQNLFLSGMGSFAVPNNILHIHRYSPKDIPAQRRLEAFEKQLWLTGQKSGNANAKYGWLGSRKQDIVSVIVNGFVSTGKNTHDTVMADGIYLSPENRAFTSVGLCDVDEKGVQYMLLCRAILGKTGVIKPGSQEEFLGIYDSGVDDCSNPNYYVIWPSHRSTNISLEYLISFRLAPKVQEYFRSLKGLWLRPPPGEVKVDPSILQPVLCQTDEGPTSPWISFRLLFETIQDSISSLARELLYRHYEELKENKITHDEMVKKMMIIVGEKLLLDSLTKLKYSPSLWYNSPAKNTSCPATLGSVCIGTSTDVVSATPSHDGPAPSVLRENCEPVNSTYGGSPASAVRGQHSPTPSMCSESSSSRCTNSQDPFASMVAPLGHDALVRSALLSVNGLDSSGPSMEYNGHDTLARSCSEGHDSHVSRPTPGNTASVSMEGLHSAAPGTTPEAHDALASNRAHESVAATPGVSCQAYTPSRVPQFSAATSMAPELCAPRSMAPHLRAPRSMAPELCAPRSMAPHLRAPRSMAPELCAPRSNAPHLRAPRSMAPELCAPRSMAPQLRAPKSMAPHLRVQSKVPKVPARKTMPEASYSSAATVVPVICKPLSSSVLPKEKSHPTSSKECMTSENVAPKNPAAQCGSNKSLPRIGVDDGSTAAYSADRLITLSAEGEKCL